MKFSKEYIIEKAFEVFLSKGYDSTSVSILQKELGMSRGALYTYFKSKEDLFIAVVDKYIINGLLKAFETPLSENVTLLEYINMRYNHFKKVIKYIDTLDYDSRFLNYTALIIQAAKYSPDFIEKVQDQKKSTHYDWEKVIRNSISKGTIKKNTNAAALANVFASGLSNIETLEISGKALMKTLNEWKKTVLYVYDLIKI